MCGDKVPKPHGNAYPLAALTDLYVHQDENFKGRLSLLVLVNVVLNRTVVVDSAMLLVVCQLSQMLLAIETRDQ